MRQRDFKKTELLLMNSFKENTMFNQNLDPKPDIYTKLKYHAFQIFVLLLFFLALIRILWTELRPLFGH